MSSPRLQTNDRYIWEDIFPIMASLFEYEKEAIRIKAKRVDRGQEEQRKFSVDPNITSFEV